MDTSAEFKAGYKAYNTGISYPRDWSVKDAFKAGWDAAAFEDAEDRFDSADAAFLSWNEGQDY